MRCLIFKELSARAPCLNSMPQEELVQKSILWQGDYGALSHIEKTSHISTLDLERRRVGT